MPLQSFNADTFVAFTDISGFKEMMKDGDRAVKAMSHLYSAGYTELSLAQTVNGLFISDCGILFVREGTQAQKLSLILQVVKKINQILLKQGVMLTTSIAWGHFSYDERIEFTGIEKNPIYGNGYLAAFMDNQAGKPKVQPGECRIVKKTISSLPQTDHAGFIEETSTHFQYFWNVSGQQQIAQFKRSYKNSYNLKYAGMLAALRGENS